MKMLLAVAAVATLSAAPVIASADEFTLDLRKIDVNTHHGQLKAEAWISERANEVCGPVDMPQPLDLREYRANCHANFRAAAWAAIDRALARNETKVSANTALASL
jgi:UrcA family protein